MPGCRVIWGELLWDSPLSDLGSVGSSVKLWVGNPQPVLKLSQHPSFNEGTEQGQYRYPPCSEPRPLFLSFRNYSLNVFMVKVCVYMCPYVYRPMCACTSECWHTCTSKTGRLAAPSLNHKNLCRGCKYSCSEAGYNTFMTRPDVLVRVLLTKTILIPRSLTLCL